MPTQVTSITPEEAATLASKVLDRTDLFSAEITQFDGVDAYLITFSSGDLVYVSLDGQDPFHFQDSLSQQLSLLKLVTWR